MKLSKTQKQALWHLQLSPSSMGRYRRNTIMKLLDAGLIERFVPGATCYSMAVRGRVGYYRLTRFGRKTAKEMKL